MSGSLWGPARHDPYLSPPAGARDGRRAAITRAYLQEAATANERDELVLVPSRVEGHEADAAPADQYAESLRQALGGQVGDEVAEGVDVDDLAVRAVGERELERAPQCC